MMMNFQSDTHPLQVLFRNFFSISSQGTRINFQFQGQFPASATIQARWSRPVLWQLMLDVVPWWSICQTKSWVWNRIGSLLIRYEGGILNLTDCSSFTESPTLLISDAVKPGITKAWFISEACRTSVTVEDMNHVYFLPEWRTRSVWLHYIYTPTQNIKNSSSLLHARQVGTIPSPSHSVRHCD